MATIKEDYVSFETAKLLKEKGFNEECWYYYHNSKIEHYFKKVNLKTQWVAELHNKEIDWLKFLKDRVQSQNTWKPSDEQMEALRKAEATIGVNHVVLAGLISDLEKLE